jgi:tRNA(Ile2) C34 agmatinyltransferase TiaS
MYFVGLDDTDILDSRGTGQLARQIAAALATDYQVLGVTRHQLLLDPRVRCTKNNSCAAIAVKANGDGHEDGGLDNLLERVRAMMLADFQPGSDPGLCVADAIPGAIVEFGRRAKEHLVTLPEAWSLAASHGIRLAGLGGDQSGAIGALAAVGLAATGEDGRYVMVGSSRELAGLQPVEALLQAGISAVETCEGKRVSEGLVLTDKLRPARRSGRPVAVVEWAGDHWLPLKLD